VADIVKRSMNAKRRIERGCMNAKKADKERVHERKQLKKAATNLQLFLMH